LSERELWGLTLMELQALKERWELNKRWQDHRAAMICTVIANAFRGRKQKPIPLDHFMPSRGPQKARQTAQDMVRVVTVLNAAFGGTVRYVDGT